jgi:hypothetical protein
MGSGPPTQPSAEFSGASPQAATVRVRVAMEIVLKIKFMVSSIY